MSNFYEFDEFRLDTEKQVLWRGDEIVGLTPKATEVLLCLIKSRGDVLKRDELLEEVWRDTFVEEGNLTHAIHSLRKALGEGMIQTVPRKGYRFTAEVRESSGNGKTELVLERQQITETVIDEIEISDDEDVKPHYLALTPAPRRSDRYRYFGVAAVILLFAVTALWWYSPGTGTKRSDGSTINSIAVLPMRSFSPDPSNDELRLRITDALITRLGGMNNLIVPPTNSVLRYAGETKDVIEAGRELGVDAVLDGRVQVENERLRITLQLISVDRGAQLWSEQFDGRVNEILALQDLISNRLRQDFAFVEQNGFNRRSPGNNESYEAYLKGRYLWNRRTKDSYFKALEYFQQSVEADPGFALGYTGIADCYYLLQQRNVLSTEDAFSKAEKAARKALELDPLLPEAHNSIGAVSLFANSRWAEAEDHYRRAIELNPNLAESHARLGMLYYIWGRFDEAFTALKRAEELDPTSINNAIYLGANYYFSRQFDRAETQFKRILEFAPQTERAHFFLTRIYELNGRYDEAVAHALKEREVFRPESVEPLRKAYETGGIRGFWQKQIELLIQESEHMHGLENHIASRYALLGDTENALNYVKKNLAVNGSMKNFGRVDPLFDSLKSDPRYFEIMNQSGPVLE